MMSNDNRNKWGDITVFREANEQKQKIMGIP